MWSRILMTRALVAACLTVFIGVGEGQAQIAAKSTGETVRNRPDPDLDPLGVHAGSMLIYPKIGVYGMYDDNMFFSEETRFDDIALRLRPVVEVESQWSRHELLLYADADFTWYDDFSSEDYETYTFQGQGTIDITQASNLLIFGSYLIGSESREDPDAPRFAAERTRYDQTDVSAQFNQEFGRFIWCVGGYFRRLDYRDTELVGGGEIDNQDRDRDQTSVNTRLDYEFQPDVGMFFDFTYNWVRYDQKVDDFGFARNSEGFELVAGLDLRFTSVIFGSFYLGYLEQTYVDPVFEKTDGFSFGADVNWNVTELTTINFSAARLLQETIQVDSSGYFADRLTITVDHALRRDWMISAFGTIGQNDYQQIDRKDKVWSIGSAVEWTVNRHLVLQLAYAHDQRSSNSPGFFDYKRNVLMFGVEARY